MKQIFDWLREQIEENKYLIVPKGKSSTYDDAETVVDIADAERMIDEAEAKWEAVIEQMEEYRAKFDCRICKYNKTERQVCTKDCTDALIDGLLEIVRKGGEE